MDEAKEALRLVRNIHRVGRVSSIDEKNGTVQVIFEDRDDLISGNLPVMEFAGKPQVRDQVLCVFLGNGIEDGFCLGSFYSKENPPPSPPWGGGFS